MKVGSIPGLSHVNDIAGTLTAIVFTCVFMILFGICFYPLGKLRTMSQVHNFGHIFLIGSFLFIGRFLLLKVFFRSQ